MRAAEHALRFLLKAGVTHLFGLPGGTVNAFYDAMQDLPDLTPIVGRHEAGAAYAAASYAKHSGKLGVVIASSGPGASNLLTGVASAARERLPLLVLTGMVPTSRMGLGAAQEASPWTMDMVAAFKPFCKQSLLIARPEDLTSAMRLAVLSALTPPFGPVHLAIPLDVQLAEVPSDRIPTPLTPATIGGVARTDLEEILKLLEAGPGVLFCGSGVKKAHAEKELRRLAEATGWTVVTTPAGKGCFPETHPLSYGVYGLAGNASAREVIRLPRMIVLGSSLGELATSNWSPDLFEGKRVIQIDHDPASLGRHYQPTLSCVADVRATIRQILPRLQKRHAQPIPRQKEKLSGLAYHLKALGSFMEGPTLLVSDIGEHMTWAIRHWTVKEHGGFDINLNYGGMGSGITSAIGAAVAQPGRHVVCLTGDGCLAMHGGELHTAVQYQLPILFVVVNNARFGMVHWGHQLQYDRAPRDFTYPPIDACAYAAALGVPALRIESVDDWRQVDFQDIFSRRGPTCIEVMDPGTDIPPMAERVAYLKGARR